MITPPGERWAIRSAVALVVSTGFQSGTFEVTAPSARPLAPPATANVADPGASVSSALVGPVKRGSLIANISVGPVFGLENGTFSSELQADVANASMTTTIKSMR